MLDFIPGAQNPSDLLTKNKRDDVQKRYSAMWVTTAEIKAELREARKAVRRVVREAKESWALSLVSEINNRESADDRWPISPKEVWQVIRALQNGPRVVRAVKPLNLRKNQLTGMGEMCETEEENREVMLNAQRKTFEQYPPHSQPAVDKVKQRETQFWMDKVPTVEEVVKATMKLANGKSGGDSNVSAEYFKTLVDNSGTRGLVHSVVVKYWKSGSCPTEDVPDGPSETSLPTLDRWLENDYPVRYQQLNPKATGSLSHGRYEAYKGCTTFTDALAHGAKRSDLRWDLERGFVTLLAPPVDRVLGPLPGKSSLV